MRPKTKGARHVRFSFTSTVIVACVACVAGLLGGLEYRHVANAVREFRSDPAFFSETTSRSEVTCTKLLHGAHMVALVLGQSNSANSGEGPLIAPAHVYNYFEGHCYEATDPLLGATGSGASVWTRVGRRLVEQGTYENVIIAPLAVDGSKVSDWAHDRKLNKRLVSTMEDLERSGLTVTHVLWHQGEADAIAGTASTTYKNDLLAVVATIRERLKTTPIYISTASRCGRVKPDPEIRRAQSEVIQVEAGILAGPDTDTLDQCYRYDGCHFSELGLERVSGLWDVRLSAPANR